MGNKRFYTLGNVLSSRVISRDKNSVVYDNRITNSYVWIIMLTVKENRRRLHIFERKLLRKIYRTIHDQDPQVWRKRQPRTNGYI